MADPSLLQFLPLMVTLQTSDDVLSSSLSEGVYTRAKLQKENSEQQDSVVCNRSGRLC